MTATALRPHGTVRPARPGGGSRPVLALAGCAPGAG
jgi:hypothetical protein